MSSVPDGVFEVDVINRSCHT